MTPKQMQGEVNRRGGGAKSNAAKRQPPRRQCCARARAARRIALPDPGKPRGSPRTTTTGCSVGYRPTPGHRTANAGRGQLSAPHGELVRRRVQVHHDRVAVGDLAGQERPGQLVADRRLDQAAQRPGAVGRVEAVQRQPVPRRRGDRPGSAGGRPAAWPAARPGGRRSASAPRWPARGTPRCRRAGSGTPA